jgi:hypothetical protein
VRLAERLLAIDRRILDSRALEPNAVLRLLAWVEAGMPDVAPDAVAFRGHDSVRVILVATLADVPAPVRWHAVRHVSWFEIGRGSPAGYMTTFQPRSIDGDSPHAIVLDGRFPDEAVPALICHEAAHAWSGRWERSDVAEPEPEPDLEPHMTEHEHHARVLAVFEGDRDAAARMLYRAEYIADECARLWGHPTDEHFSAGQRRLQLFRERMDAAADRAAEIGREVDAHIEQRAAAAVTKGAQP